MKAGIVPWYLTRAEYGGLLLDRYPFASTPPRQGCQIFGPRYYTACACPISFLLSKTTNAHSTVTVSTYQI